MSRVPRGRGGKAMQRIQRSPVGTIVCTPNTKAWLWNDFLPTSLLHFSRRQKYKYFPAAYKTKNLSGAKWALKYYILREQYNVMCVLSFDRHQYHHSQKKHFLFLVTKSKHPSFHNQVYTSYEWPLSQLVLKPLSFWKYSLPIHPHTSHFRLHPPSY